MDRNIFIPYSSRALQENELACIAVLLGTSYSADHKVDYAPLHCIALHCTRGMQTARLDAISLLPLPSCSPWWRSGESSRSSMSEGIMLQWGALCTIPLAELLGLHLRSGTRIKSNIRTCVTTNVVFPKGNAKR